MQLKVLHVSPSIARADGGPSELIRGLMPSLREMDVDVSLLSTDKGMQRHDHDLSRESWVIVEPARGHPSFTFSPSLPKRLREMVPGSDVVHVHGLQSFPGSAAMRICRHYGVPYVLQPHGALDAYSWRRHRFRKSAYALADRKNWRSVGGVIYASAKEAADGASVFSGRVAATIPPGVEDNLLHVERASSVLGERTAVLFLGRLSKVKRLDLVLAAMAVEPLSQTTIELIVAGSPDGSMSPDPVEFARRSGIADRVKFLGTVDKETRRQLFTRVSALVLPSDDESFGMAAAEAMAAGVPTIVSPHVGIASLPGAASALRLVPQDPVAISQAIVDVIHDAELAQSGREYAQQHFSWRAAAASTLSFYQRVVDLHQTGKRQ
ncbi:glycosyltransferase [Microbacterium sp. NPDC078428]|uniref:glycosyltransferase n=1 Tax=Microbacterium sp. NPDC078428 TaxID=3364190 RepID=UPI0037C94061